MIFSVLFSVALAAPLCSPEGGTSTSKTDITDGLAPAVRAFCTDIKNLRENREAVNKPLCSAFWTDGNAWWKKITEKNPESLNKNSGEYKDPSRRDMLKAGYTFASEAQLVKINEEFSNMKARTAIQCCGSDQRCITTYMATSLRFCSDPKSEQDETAPDPCASSGSAYFTVDRKTQLTYFANYNHWERMPPETLAQIMDQMKMNGEPNFVVGSINPGYISLNRYISPRGKSDDYTYRHELGHACNFVRRQLAVKDGVTNYSMKDSVVTEMAEYCKQSSQPSYDFTMLDNAYKGKNTSPLKNCIQQGIEEETNNTKDYAYIPNACFNSKIEEATADAFSALTAQKNEAGRLIWTLCTNSPSAIHYSGYKTLECVMKYAPEMNTVIADGIECPK